MLISLDGRGRARLVWHEISMTDSRQDSDSCGRVGSSRGLAVTYEHDRCLLAANKPRRSDALAVDCDKVGTDLKIDTFSPVTQYATTYSSARLRSSKLRLKLSKA